MHWIYANDQIWKQFQETDHWFYFIKRIGYSDHAKSFVNYEC